MKEFEDASWSHLLPSADLEVDPHNFHEFFRTMCERQKIYMKRSVYKTKAPWTDDKILRDYNFTNVYRELDRNSDWEIKNIISNLDLSKKDVIWQVCLFRMFNKIELFEFIRKSNTYSGNPIPTVDEFDSSVFLDLVRSFRRTGQNPYTSSYYVNSTFGKGLDKDSAFCKLALTSLHKTMPKIMRTIMIGQRPEELIEVFETIPGVGPFMSHEFYISLCYAEKYWNKPVMRWGQNDYTNVGPGASMGLRLIFPSLKVSQQKQGIYWLRDLAPEYMHEHFIEFEFLKWDPDRRARYFTRSTHNLTLHQIEMWLCEYSKYWKMVHKLGKQRSKFTPRSQY